MYNRYSRTDKIINNSEEYEDLLKKKKLNILMHYSSFDFSKLKQIAEQNFDYVIHTVQPYERLDQISQKYYNAPEYGWLICYINKIPNETEISAGQTLIIYYPIDVLLRYL